MSSDSSIHKDHRKRVKERFCREGLDNFNEINVLELLLFYCVQRRDTNPLAHRLLDHFGKLSNVLEATREELMQVEGVTENIAVYLSFIKDVSRYYMVNQSEKPVVLTSIDECAKYIRPYFVGRPVETVFLLCLDAKCKVICCKKVSEGGVNSAPISSRKVVEMAILSKATSVVLAHNHPSGIAVPSVEDVQVTGRICTTLKGVDVTLVDHIVFGDDGDYVSMVQSKCYAPELREDVQIIGGGQ